MPPRVGLIGVQFDPGNGASQFASCTSHYYNLKWPFNLRGAHKAYKPSIYGSQMIEIHKLIISPHNLDSHDILGQDML